MARKRKGPEEQVQRSIVDWLSIHERQGRLSFFHVPNGGYRTKAEAGVMKALGQKPGVYDLFVMWFDGVGFMEVKPKGGYLRPVQKAFGQRLDGFNIPWAVVRSTEDADRALREWGVLK